MGLPGLVVGSQARTASTILLQADSESKLWSRTMACAVLMESEM
jgi:hypothetical protein